MFKESDSSNRQKLDSLFYNKSARHERQEGYTNDTSATRVKNLDFDNDTSKNIFSYPYISYMANERLQGEEQFHSKNYLLEMPRSHANMYFKEHHKNWTLWRQKLYQKVIH